MSIISEALNKVQNKREKESPPLPRVKLALEPIQRKSSSRTLIILGCILIISFALLVLKSMQPVSESIAPKSNLLITEKVETIKPKIVSIKDTAMPKKTNIKTSKPAPPTVVIPDRTVAPTMQLNGLMYSEVSPKAIINGKIVTTGDKVSGFTVKDILPGGVLLSKDGETIELELD